MPNGVIAIFDKDISGDWYFSGFMYNPTKKDLENAKHMLRSPQILNLGPAPAHYKRVSEDG